jgi:thiol-disulfide isomerase/thioredoxin
LSEVTSGETFSISSLSDKPVLLESFAVWCPTCTKQQREILEFHEEVGESVVSVSLDTEPNEDESVVREHASDNGFTWRYTVSPADVTQSLISDFGVENEDNRVHAKTVIFGIEVNGAFSAYREDDLISDGVILDSVSGVDVRVERFDDGRVVVTNVDTGEEIVKERDFWFAWYAFHPDTELYGVPAAV